jgi:ureidoglycolate dehydrogenase (NAD+)/L-2-hydroxycarboxylate dehydrogenase (NAD+)
MREALAHREISQADADFIISDYVDAELEGYRTHGIGKFLLIDNALEQREGAAVVGYVRGSTARVDGNKDLGHIAARLAVNTAIDLARSHGIGLVSIRNFSRFSRLAPHVKRIAAEGFIGILTNNAGPPAVAPYGSRDPILGTNPIAFGFPGREFPTVLDFATSRQVWGEIRQAQLEGRPLSSDSFLDAEGNVTTDPGSANAVLPFGGAKGSALCLAIELLMGGITGAATGLQVQNEYDLGAVVIAMEPVPGSDRATAELLSEIRQSRPREAGGQVYVPGERAQATLLANRGSGEMDIDGHTLDVLQGMAAGSPGLAANNLTN